MSTNLDSRKQQSSNLIKIFALTVRNRCKLKQSQGTPNCLAGKQQILCFNCLTVSGRGPEWLLRQGINGLKIHEIHVMFQTRPLDFVKYSKNINTTCIKALLIITILKLPRVSSFILPKNLFSQKIKKQFQNSSLLMVFNYLFGVY